MNTADFLFDGEPDADLTLILAHGAGLPMDGPFMTAIAGGLAERGFRVARFEFPYMVRRRADGRRRPPDRQPVLLESWRAAVAALGGGTKVVVGGKSLGGRMASLIADEVCARGLVCLGYPFHAPGRPDNPRVAHLADLTTPALIVQGERDPFGGTREVGGYRLSSAIAVHWLADGDHDFKPRKASGRTVDDNRTAAIDAVAGFLAGLEPPTAVDR